MNLFFNYECELGEGPMFHPDGKHLYWVDILDKKLHRLDTETMHHKEYLLPAMPGAVVPVHNTDLLLLSLENGAAYFNPDTEKLDYIIHYHEGRPDMRANDGKCDPAGNFWIGTMSKSCEQGAGALFKLNSDLSTNFYQGDKTISNGLAWNPEGTKMYYIDSINDSIQLFDYNQEVGPTYVKDVVKNQPYRYFDGMTIDVDGMLWVAHCNQGKICRWNPIDGHLLEEYCLPVPKCTSLCFGGNDLKTLYITTAREHMTTLEKEIYPLSGSVFTLLTKTHGFYPHSFKPKMI